MNMPLATLRALKGAPLSIIVALLLEPTRAGTLAYLRAATGYSANSLRAAVTTLAELQLVHSLNNKLWLTSHCTQLFLLHDRPLTDNTQNLSPLTDNTQNLSPLTDNTQNLSPLTDTTQNLSPLHHCNSSSSSSNNQPAIIDHTTTTTNAQNLSATLQTLGIFPDLAERLAADPWVTETRAQAWYRNLHAQNAAQPGTIQSVPALLATNLARHHEPPPPPSRTSRLRFVEGDYAEYIQR